MTVDLFEDRPDVLGGEATNDHKVELEIRVGGVVFGLGEASDG